MPNKGSSHLIMNSQLNFSQTELDTFKQLERMSYENHKEFKRPTPLHEIIRQNLSDFLKLYHHTLKQHVSSGSCEKPVGILSINNAKMLMNLSKASEIYELENLTFMCNYENFCDIDLLENEELDFGKYKDFIKWLSGISHLSEALPDAKFMLTFYNEIERDGNLIPHAMSSNTNYHAIIEDGVIHFIQAESLNDFYNKQKTHLLHLMNDISYEEAREAFNGKEFSNFKAQKAFVNNFAICAIHAGISCQGLLDVLSHMEEQTSIFEDLFPKSKERAC